MPGASKDELADRIIVLVRADDRPVGSAFASDRIADPDRTSPGCELDDGAAFEDRVLKEAPASYTAYSITYDRWKKAHKEPEDHKDTAAWEAWKQANRTAMKQWVAQFTEATWLESSYTAALIEESQGNAGNGVAVTNEVAQLLRDMVEKVQKVAELVAEVSAASDEQAQGIDQVNVAVSQMDRVTQSNASNAEESASASEELASTAEEVASQAEAMQELVSFFRVAGVDTARRRPVRPAAPRTFQAGASRPHSTGSGAVAGNGARNDDHDFKRF
jgi:mannitol/fructose-specific phosphotransferase system IIA component